MKRKSAKSAGAQSAFVNVYTPCLAQRSDGSAAL
jgi:hypothetical protein